LLNGTTSVTAHMDPKQTFGPVQLSPLRSRLNAFEQLTHRYIEVCAKLVDDLELDALRSLRVEPRERVAMDPRRCRHVADLELSLAKQSSEVATDHEICLQNVLQ
jgi:hypothetical protein